MTNADKIMNVAAFEGTHTWLQVLAADSVRHVVDDKLCLILKLSLIGCCGSRRLDSADSDPDILMHPKVT